MKSEPLRARRRGGGAGSCHFLFLQLFSCFRRFSASGYFIHSASHGYLENSGRKTLTNKKYRIIITFLEWFLPRFRVTLYEVYGKKIFKGWSIFWTLLPALQHNVVPKKEMMKSKRVVRSGNVQHFKGVGESKKKKTF